MKSNVERTVETAAREIFLQLNNPLVFIFIEIVGLYTEGKILQSDIGGISTVCVAVF